MRTAAVLPVKSFDRAKQRLGPAVTASDRIELADAMLADVLAALGAAAGLADLIVVTADARARDAALAAGAHVVEDPLEAGQSSAADRGVAAARARGAERVLLVPGDCPALDPADVERVLGAFPDAGLVIVPDRHGAGTNALRIAPPDAIAPSFGAGSLARHAVRGATARLTVRIARAPSLELDIDTDGDLAALRAALATRPDVAARTRALLERRSPSPVA
jgi:2-phospho-L-lactate guanylyltransferase